MQELKVDNKIKVEKQGKKDEKEMESDQGEENNEKPNNIDRKDDKDIIYNEDSGDYLEDLEGSEKDSQDNEDKRYILKYNLSSVYFIKTNDYFKNFSTNKIIKRDFQKFLAFKGIPYEKEFREAIKKNGMLNKLFLETIKKIKCSDEINKLKNGLFLYQNKKLLLCSTCNQKFFKIMDSVVTTLYSICVSKIVYCIYKFIYKTIEIKK